jgi:hypothetical protein
VTLLFRLLQPLGWQEWKIIVEDIIVDLSGPEFSAATSGYTKEVEDMLKMLSPSTMSFIKNLPAIEGRHTSLSQLDYCLRCGLLSAEGFLFA